MPADAAPPFVCRFARGNEAECGMPFGNKRALATHQGLVHTADEIGATYRCPMPGCLFGTNTERYLNRHVSNMHGGIFTPVLYFAGEALMMTAVQEAQNDVGDTFVLQAKTSHSLKGQNRAALRSNFDAYAEAAIYNAYTVANRILRIRKPANTFFAENRVEIHTRPNFGCSGGSCGLAAVAALLSLARGVPLQPIAMSSAIDGIFMEVQAVGRIRAKL
ncbi:hypothetical protein niasHT_032157 [Heterodera trifolii]|uniref:C2H2-type domain-containing protein n=1 Tax=Heterodera trifolii TaxID=157864 RepID=A0ABD2HUU7_9BILA